MKKFLYEMLVMQLRYFAIGIACIPAGIVWATLSLYGYKSHIVFGLCIAGGLVLCHFAWNMALWNRLQKFLNDK